MRSARRIAGGAGHAGEFRRQRPHPAGTGRRQDLSHRLLPAGLCLQRRHRRRSSAPSSAQGLDIGYVARRNALIQAVTLDDVKRVAKRLFDPARLTVVVAGTRWKASAPQTQAAGRQVVRRCHTPAGSRRQSRASRESRRDAQVVSPDRRSAGQGVSKPSARVRHAPTLPSPSLSISLCPAKAPSPRAAYDAALAEAAHGAGLAARAAREQSRWSCWAFPRAPTISTRRARWRRSSPQDTTDGRGAGHRRLEPGRPGADGAAQAVPQGPRVEFHDNPDPFTWAAALTRFDLKKTHFIAISKSGGTAETLMQVLTAADALEKAGGGKYSQEAFHHHHRAAARARWRISPTASARPMLDHPTGRRRALFGADHGAACCPALLMGIDVKQLRAGAQAALDQALNAKTPADAPAACGAALHHALAAAGQAARRRCCGPMPTSWRCSAAGGGSSGPRAWARTARARRRCRCWARWTSTASCSCSATGRATRCSP